jgi:hypothetical protein
LLSLPRWNLQQLWSLCLHILLCRNISKRNRIFLLCKLPCWIFQCTRSFNLHDLCGWPILFHCRSSLRKLFGWKVQFFDWSICLQCLSCRLLFNSRCFNLHLLPNWYIQQCGCVFMSILRCRNICKRYRIFILPELPCWIFKFSRR